MDYSIADIECDGFNPSKIYCLSVIDYKDGIPKSFTLTDYNQMRAFLKQCNIFVCHNAKRFDIPVIEKILGIKVTCRVIDTLALAWYLSPELNKVGLEHWGEYFGVPKPPISDWFNLPIEIYKERCEEDVKINEKLFHQQISKLKAIYEDGNIDRIINYLMFKMDCAQEQQEMRWRVDVVKCEQGLAELEAAAIAKQNNLIAAMPRVIKYKTVSKPEKMVTQKNELSAAGRKWYELLNQLGLPVDHAEPIQVEESNEPGNPNSSDQLKAWLYSLGWIPQSFAYVKNKEGEQRKIAQINKISPEEGICDSIPILYEREPALKNIESLGVITHRMGILKGMLTNKDEEGFVKAEIAGFTNTLRFRHKILVNLPTVVTPYGSLIRGCLIAPSDDYILCGSDMSSLEDSTKQHYMYYFDPKYVTEMRTPGFDPHIDIAFLADMITSNDVELYKNYDKDATNPSELTKRYKEIKEIRSGKAKKTNFAAVYGAGGPKIALTANISLSEGKLLHRIYWKRNKAVKQVAAACTVKTIDNQMWLYNPVSKFWYSLRFDKDRFSTLNQSTGVYCFDRWVSHNRQAGIKICGQFHDEIAFPVLKGDENKVKSILYSSIDKVNDEIKLNVKLGISVDMGNSYADIH